MGQLRDYQREGLGWMEFLRRFAFGGCLADDMGVGKTAQVLALFETRRELRAGGQPVAPSLVVVPRSLVFNWKQESERFTPQLRVLDYTGLARERSTGGRSRFRKSDGTGCGRRVRIRYLPAFPTIRTFISSIHTTRCLTMRR